MTRDSRALAARPAAHWPQALLVEVAAHPPAALVVGAGIALAIVQAVLASMHSMWATASMVLAVLLFAGLFTRLLGLEVGTLALLIATTVTDRFTFPAGSFNLRAEEVAAGFAVVVLVASRLRDRPVRLQPPNFAETALLAWFAIALVSSLAVAPNRFDSLKVLGLLMISTVAVFVPRRLLAADPRKLDEATRWLLLAVAAESVYALSVFFVHVLGPTLSMSENRGQLAVYGTLWEPNVLGALCAAGTIAWTFLGRLYYSRQWIGIALCASASIVTFTRAAWIAIAVVLAVTLVTSLRRRVDLRAIPIAALATVIVAGAVLAAERLANYYPKDPFVPLHGTTNIGGNVGDRIDIIGRIYQVAPVLHDLRANPFVGDGIASFGQHYVAAGVPEHIANLELSLLNDTGVLGVLAFAAFALAVFVSAWRESQDPMVLGLAATVLVIATTNQATETLELMITWLLVGLLTTAVSIRSAQRARERSHRSRYRLVTSSQL